MKYERQAKILELIEKHIVETQEELSGLLRENGFDATQATVSRDMKELKLVKIAVGDGRSKYSALLSQHFLLQGQLLDVFRSAYLSSDYANNMVLVNTLPGMAQAVASAIDSLKLGEVLGTIAGDDSVLIVCRAEKYAEEIVSILNRMAR